MTNAFILPVDSMPHSDPTPNTIVNNTAAVTLSQDPFEDIKYTLCGYGQQLEYLNYGDMPSNSSTTTTENSQYSEYLGGL